MQPTTLATALLILTPVLALADPFNELTKGGNDACFRRDYDVAHLKKIPRQQVTSMMVWINGKPEGGSGNVGLAVTRRGDPQPLFLVGGCDWGDDQSWMKSYPRKRGGAGCVTLAVPDVFESSSAEEGGGVLLDPAADGKTMRVYVDELQSMVKRADRARKISVSFGADDRVFLLRRTGAKDCEFVREAVTTPEPGVRR